MTAHKVVGPQPREGGGQALALTLDALVARAQKLTVPARRRLLGITGAPGAGKSTLSGCLASALGSAAALVPMDGFHLANQELVRLGRRQSKGAPDTFDVDGYVTLLARLRPQLTPIVYAPTFDRACEEPRAGAIAVLKNTPLVITEGNYLLYSDLGWERVRGLVDEIWYLDVPVEERVERLVRRRLSFGDSADCARQWVREVDLKNAALVEAQKQRADLVVQLLGDVVTSTHALIGQAHEGATSCTRMSSDA